MSVLQMPLIMLPNVINQAIAASVALARIKSFLLAPALTRGGVNTTAKIGEVAVRVDKSSFSWSKASGVALRDVKLAIRQGGVCLPPPPPPPHPPCMFQLDISVFLPAKEICEFVRILIRLSEF
jgi:hypothetical protein